MSDRERRILRLEEVAVELQSRTASAEARAAAVEQSRWQRDRPSSSAMGRRLWLIQLLGCYDIPLDGETIDIVDYRTPGLPVIGSGATDASGLAVVVTYGGDLSGDVQVESSPSRFDASTLRPYGGASPFTLTGADESVTTAVGQIDPDATHVPGPVNDPRPWGLTMTIDDSVLSVSGATLTWQANPGHDTWYGTTTGNFAAGGTCGAASGIPLAYEVDLSAQFLATAGARVYWRANGPGCPTAGAGSTVFNELLTLTSTPGPFTGTITGLVGTSKLYPGGSPTLSITGT